MPPSSRSFPARPMRRSLPPKPKMESSFGVPVRVLLVLLPRIIAMISLGSASLGGSLLLRSAPLDDPRALVRAGRLDGDLVEVLRRVRLPTAAHAARTDRSIAAC